jgi:anti-sigma regulatory factor (Ser/Thr protein kinase)
MRMTVEDRDQRECLRVTELTLASLPDAPSCGRLLVQRYLSAWGIAHMIDEAQLVMSELLTNAVKANAEFATIHIRLAVLGGTSLLIEIRDCNPEPPVLKDASADNEGGRGLMIVDALCERWGYYRPDKISDGLEAELYALLEQLDTATAEQSASTGT